LIRLKKDGIKGMRGTNQIKLQKYENFSKKALTEFIIHDIIITGKLSEKILYFEEVFHYEKQNRKKNSNICVYSHFANDCQYCNLCRN